MDKRVVACVIRRGELLLLAQRPPHKRYGGLWEFPGGKVEPNESDRDAAARELQEELGVRLVRAREASFVIADLGSPYSVAFVPVEVQGEPVPSEHSSLVWGQPQELLELPLAPSDRAFLNWLVASDSQRVDG